MNLAQAVLVPMICSGWSFGKMPHSGESKTLKGVTDMEQNRMDELEKLKRMVRRVSFIFRGRIREVVV